MPHIPPREAAAAALGEPVERWIERHRSSSARLTYRQIARVLAAECGVDVTPQAVRLWHKSDSSNDASAA